MCIVYTFSQHISISFELPEKVHNHNVLFSCTLINIAPKHNYIETTHK